MVDWTDPTTASLYTQVLTDLNNKDIDVATMFIGSTSTNIATNSIRLDAASTGVLERWNGAAWVAQLLTLSAGINLISAADPRIQLYDEGEALDEKRWDVLAQGSSFFIRAYDDTASSSLNPFQITRTGLNIDVITLTGDSIVLTGTVSVSSTVDGRNIASDGTTQDTHIADASIHTEDNLLVHLAGTESITGTKTFTSPLNINTVNGQLRLYSTGAADPADIWYLDNSNGTLRSFWFDDSAATFHHWLSVAPAGAVALQFDGSTKLNVITGGVDITGNLGVTGNVDGRDVSADGLILDDLPVANLANGTDGELITWSATGAPTTVAVGTVGQLLTSNGAGAAPTFETPVSASVKRGSNQSIASRTWVRINFNSERWDIGSYYDSTTNYRYTPGVAGKYLVTWSIRNINGNGGVEPFMSRVRKNAVIYSYGSSYYGGFEDVTVGSTIIDVNGSTDYIDLQVYQYSTLSKNMDAFSEMTFVKVSD